MPDDAIWLRNAIVVGSALVYWGGVLVQTYRIRRRIGRSPNVKPHGLKERLLWLGWMVVVLGWIGQPSLIGRPDIPLVSLMPFLLHEQGMFLGSLLLVGGYAGTLWCYVALGDAWRLGIRRRERTVLIRTGPYRFVRHPIYLFQCVMLLGAAIVLPTLFSFLMLGLQLFCVFIKAMDEEAYLMQIHGSEYAEYLRRTGRFLPSI